MNFEQCFNTLEKKEKFNVDINIGTFSDIESTINFYAFDKAVRDLWGNEQDEELSRVIQHSFPYPDIELVKKFNDISLLAKDNDETLRWLAFAVEKGEPARSFTVKNIVKHKGLSEEEANNLFSEFKNFYHQIKGNLVDTEAVSVYVDQDIKLRKEELPRLKNQINEAIDFFNPKESAYKNITYLPTNPLEMKQSGSGIPLGDTYYINSERENEINQVHEFLHSIINPITEKLNFSDGDEKAVLDLCRSIQKDHYVYPLSIFTEEIIRTYKTGFVLENKPGFDSFKDKILSIDKEVLQEALIEERKRNNSDSTIDAVEFLGDEHIMRKYYEKYNKNELSERIWDFFTDYQSSSSTNFEHYLLNNYQNILHKNADIAMEK